MFWLKKTGRLTGFFNSLLQTNKPDSVRGYHLSVPKITLRNQAAYPFQPYSEQASHLPSNGY